MAPPLSHLMVMQETTLSGVVFLYLFEELVGVNARDIKFSKKGPSPSRAIPHQLLLWTVPLRQTTVANCVRPWSPGTSHGFSGFLYLPSVWKGYGSPEGCGTGACFAHWARQAPVCLRFLLIGASRMGYVRAAALKPAWGFHPQPPSSFRSALRNFISPLFPTCDVYSAHMRNRLYQTRR